jgi:tetratricopeptide (TPR) repeat protein
MHDLPTAAFHFKEVTRLDPLRAGAYINLGAVYNLLDQLDDAIPVLRRGIQLDAQRAEGHYNLALVYRRKGQAELAIRAYQETLRVNPRTPDAHFNLANLYMERGEYAQALTHYKFALQLRPNWDRAATGLEQAEEAIAAKEEHKQPAHPTPEAERAGEPLQQGSLLARLDQAVVESEESNRRFLQVLETEIEPVFRELSTRLSHPDSPLSEFGPSVPKFEAAIQHLRDTQRNLQASLEQLRTLSDRLRRR